MPTWFSQLRNLVWTAVLAVASGIVALVTAVLGDDLELVAGFGVLGLILAVLAQKS
jgi:hypothetical protein